MIDSEALCWPWELYNKPDLFSGQLVWKTTWIRLLFC